ncbi:MAG: hypothetical protein QXI36_07910, partial [Candidatus Bathyarchaeia archaeon]
YEQRWRRVQKAMSIKGYDLLYVCGSELDRSDAAWLAGVFDPMIERYAVILPLDGKPLILAGSEGGHVLEEAAEKSGADIVLLREFQISDEEYRWARFTDLGDVLKRLGLLGGVRVAVASAPGFLPCSHLFMLQSIFGKDNVIIDPEILRVLKYEKSDLELALMQEANKIADAALRGMLAVTVPGV